MKSKVCLSLFVACLGYMKDVQAQNETFSVLVKTSQVNWETIEEKELSSNLFSLPSLFLSANNLMGSMGNEWLTQSQFIYLRHLEMGIASNKNYFDLLSFSKKNSDLPMMLDKVYYPYSKGSQRLQLSESNQDKLLRNPRRVSKLDWSLNQIRVAQAWRLSTAGQGAKVIILDEGIDFKHPAIRGRIHDSKVFFGLGDMADPFGHGTHVASLVGGVDGYSGFYGVAPRSQLTIAKVCDGVCQFTAIVKAIDWALEKKSDIAVMSFTSNDSSDFEEAIFEKAFQKGLTMISASGNSAFNEVGFPSAYPSVFSVGAIDKKNKRADFSQFGVNLDLVAPGVAVNVAVPEGFTKKVSFIKDKKLMDVDSRWVWESRVSDQSITAQIKDVGLARSHEIENQDFENNIVLVRSGELSWQTKVQNLLPTKPKAIILVLRSQEIQKIILEQNFSVPIMVVNFTDGQKLLRLAQQNESIQLDIVKTYYEKSNGTSLAAPIVAGVAALMKSLQPTWGPDKIYDGLKKTAVKIVDQDPLNEYGAGRVDALNAVLEVRK